MSLPPLSPRRYLELGLAFMAVKYAGDALLVYLATGQIWTPLDYATSLLWNVSPKLDLAPGWLLWSLGLWVLPFLYIGVRLTLRRLADADWSPWLVMLFFVPFVNYVLMLTLVAAPTATVRVESARPVISGRRVPWPASASAIVAMIAGGLVGIGGIALTVQVLSNYGAALFLAIPFAMGVVSGYSYKWLRPDAGRGQTMGAGLASTLALGLFLLGVGIEGVACLLMSLPIGGPIVMFGASVGWSIAGDMVTGRSTIGLFLLPLGIMLEPSAGAGQPAREVLSVVEIAASPEQVWPHVVAFRPLSAPTDLLFRAGIAYPMSARIEGQGVGAIRYCEFSTGAFVEPITAWEPGRRLAFDVTRSPPPLREWSFYDNVSAPHLDGFLQSRRGEFKLIPLPNGGTRLEGRTWYQVRMAPEWYWRIWSDAIIHRIHARVLDHIRNEATR